MEVSESLVSTRASVLKGVNKIETVTFTSYKPKYKNGSKESVDKQTEENPVFVIKKAKTEMMKFAMSNLEGQEKRNATMQLAIKLGAKPPRNRYKNYKNILEEKKRSKIKEESNTHLQKIGKNAFGKSTAKIGFDKKRRKNEKLRKSNKGLLEVYGTVNVP